MISNLLNRNICSSRQGAKLLLLLAGTLSNPAMAQVISLEPQPLSSALFELAEISGFQILFPENAVQGIDAPALEDIYEIESALAMLLQGQDFEFANSNGVITIREAEAVELAPIRPRLQPAAIPRPDFSQAMADMEEVLVTGSRLLLPPSQMAKQVINYTADHLAATGEPALEWALLRLPQNFRGLTANSFVRGGSELPGGNQNPAGALDLAASSTVNLRGLGTNGVTDTTLMLVNGRRLIQSGTQGNIQDISGIPLANVERVEIILDGASAIYGSDAIGGVVNIITKDELDGFDASLSYLNGIDHFGNAEINASLIGGWSWDSGNLSLALAAKDQPDIRAQDVAYRTIFYDDPYNRSTGELNLRSGFFSASPPTIFFGSLNDQRWGRQISGGDSPGLDDIDLSGSLPGPTYHDNATVLPGVRQYTVDVSLRQNITDKLRLNASLRYLDRSVFEVRSDHATFYRLDADHPRNPFDEAVTVANTFPALGQPGSNSNRRTYGATFGLDWEFSDNWNLSTTLSHDVNDQESIGFGGITADLSDWPDNFNPWGDGSYNLTTPYDDGMGGNTWIDPFDGSVRSGSISDYIHRLGSPWSVSENTQTIADAVLRGNGFQTPGGTSRFVFGVEHRSASLLTDSYKPVVSRGGIGTGFNFFNTSERDTAIFAEMFLPIIGGSNSRRGIREFSLTAAVRHERTSISGDVRDNRDNENSGQKNEDDATTWSMGLSWSPTASLRFKVNYGTAFKVQSANNLFQPIIATEFSLERCERSVERLGGPAGHCPVPIGFSTVTDPDDRWQPAGYTRLIGGNPDLKPERSETLSIGAEFTPVENISISAFWNRKHFRDKALNPLVFSRILSQEAAYTILPQVFVPYPDGISGIETVNYTLLNLESSIQDNLDIHFDYYRNTGFGDLSLRLNYTQELKNTEFLGGGIDLPAQDFSEIRNPKHSGQITLQWSRNQWLAGIDTVYRGRTFDEQFHSGSQTWPAGSGYSFDPHWISNVQASYSFAPGRDWLSGVSLNFGINNILNTEPETSFWHSGVKIATLDVSNARVGDPRLRSFYFKLSKSF